MQTTYLERYKAFGLKVAYYRKMADLTQEALAEQIGRNLILTTAAGRQIPLEKRLATTQQARL